MRDIPGINKDLQALAYLAYDQGWVLSVNPQGKVVWKPPDKTKPLVYTATNLAGRNLDRAKSQLAKSGLDVSSLRPDQAKAQVADVEATRKILQEKPGTAIPLPDVVRAEMPDGPAQVEAIKEVVGGLTSGPAGFDEAMAAYIYRVSLALADYVNQMNYKLGGTADKDLEDALKMLETSEQDLQNLNAQLAKKTEDLTRANKECGEAKQAEAAALERAVAAENKFASLKRLLSD